MRGDGVLAQGEFDYDLFVIGGGSGGVRAARRTASLGKRVAIAEEYRYGGTCVIRGCVPKKLLVYASQFSEAFEDAAGYGWSVGERSFDWPTLIAAKDREIDRLEGVYRRNLDRSGAEIFESRAVIAGPHEVRLLKTDTVVTAERILIAAGGRARRKPPPVPRVLSSSPADDNRLTSFCAVGSGTPVSSASSVAFSRAPPQWRAAADIITTA